MASTVLHSVSLTKRDLIDLRDAVKMRRLEVLYLGGWKGEDQPNWPAQAKRFKRLETILEGELEAIQGRRR